MGRPLKIAKAVILTMTATNGSAETVTVTESLTNLSIISGMPFVVATTGGGLTAGTTYWILTVTSEFSFTVSATHPSANPTYTPVNLSTTGPVSIKLSVGITDSGFQNPDTAAQSGNTSTNPGASYGAVGGNTTIYGPQTIAQVAIGIAGSGLVYAVTSSADVWGIQTDFANVTGLGAGSAIQFVNSVDGSTTNVGFVSSLYRVDTTVTNTYANGYVRVDDNTGFNLNKPVYLTGNIGGLVANTPYFVTEINGGGHLVTLSARPTGGNVALSAAVATVPVIAEAVTLTAHSTANTSIAGVTYFAGYNYANDEAGYIVRQKGKQKYLVTGLTTTLTAQCYTANVANTALTPNTMSIVSTNAAAGNVYVQSLSDYNTLLFNDVDGNIQNAAPVTATFGLPYVANTYYTPSNPIVTINNG